MVCGDKSNVMNMIDCICDIGRNIPPGQANCPYCGVDLTPLHRLRSLPEKCLSLGEEQRKKGNHEEAIRYYLTAITLSPGLVEPYVEPYLALCIIYAERGQFNKALVYSDRGLLISPSDPRLNRIADEVEAMKIQAKRSAAVPMPPPPQYPSNSRRKGTPGPASAQPQPSDSKSRGLISRIFPSKPENPAEVPVNPDGTAAADRAGTVTNSSTNGRKKGQRKTKNKKQ